MCRSSVLDFTETTMERGMEKVQAELASSLLENDILTNVLISILIMIDFVPYFFIAVISLTLVYYLLKAVVSVRRSFQKRNNSKEIKKERVRID
jgi:hypothetical protein